MIVSSSFDRTFKLWHRDSHISSTESQSTTSVLANGALLRDQRTQVKKLEDENEDGGSDREVGQAGPTAGNEDTTMLVE